MCTNGTIRLHLNRHGPAYLAPDDFRRELKQSFSSRAHDWVQGLDAHMTICTYPSAALTNGLQHRGRVSFKGIGTGKWVGKSLTMRWHWSRLGKVGWDFPKAGGMRKRRIQAEAVGSWILWEALGSTQGPHPQDREAGCGNPLVPCFGSMGNTSLSFLFSRSSRLAGQRPHLYSDV